MSNNFTIYVDKENSSETSIANPVQSAKSTRTTVGKSFHSSVRTGPRKALKEVNAANIEGTKASVQDIAAIKEAALKQLHHKQQTQNLTVKEHKENEVKEVIGVKTEVTATEPACEDEIEFMLPYDEQKEDDLEDIWPRTERPSSYMSAFRDWRPRSIFPGASLNSPLCSEEPTGYVSDDEEEPVRDYSFESDTPLEPPTEEINIPELDLDDFNDNETGETPAPFDDMFSQLMP